MITLQDVQMARNRISPFVRKTPVEYAWSLSERTGGSIYCKMESQQINGSFKLRGAANRMVCLTESEKSKGIITASAGNHSQGVAEVARRMGIDALIIMPENAPDTKVKRTEQLGAAVLRLGRDYDESEKIAHEKQKETGRVYIHAFLDPLVVAGQGTVGLEFLEEIPDLDMLLVPVGGGGLIMGVATAAKALSPGIRVIGIQPETSCPWYEAIHTGSYVQVPIGDSVADGLTGDILDPEMIPDFCSVVDDVVKVSESELRRAVDWMVREQRQIVEGSGAAGIAALLAGKVAAAGKKAGVVISGGNLDHSVLMDILKEWDRE